ncbi:MAG: DEAD/DEAH box helicase [Lachnospiraceae bacterium]|nr:DEAD/DEAH box helicase [Lachnospiraceae bacterium]
MTSQIIEELYSGFETAYIDGSAASNILYKPQFVSNNYREGKKVLSYIEDELLACDYFQISVAFITMGGITPLLQTLKELEKRGIPGEILTTNYLNFSEPAALRKLHGLKNITLKMYDTEAADTGFHTKGYIFKSKEIYRIIIGSSNITSAALTCNKEWNTKLISTQKGEVATEIVEEFHQLWSSGYAFDYNEFIDTYEERYRIIEKQKKIAREEKIPSLETYKLKPNDMQIGFIGNLRNILKSGEERALLISATGTGKTYASAFAMRELGFKRVLFLVHRGQLARQTKKSYERIFGSSVSMGLVGAGYHEYDKDYVFATIQTLNREAHLANYQPNDFDCIILDEAHHSSADSYQKIMGYFRPRFWLGMTATPDKRDDNEPGRNIYEIFHYQIAYEIRLQQAMEENMLCPFHYFGISEVAVVEEKEVKARKISIKDFSQLVSDERVKHIIEQAEYYGYSGERVKGLVFCSRVEESKELSDKFNKFGYRTISLNGDASEEERIEAFERLAMDEGDTDSGREPLDYIFSVEILNEGVDIVEVNQIIMLRPTQSPIVFIQQLGRGLRKSEGKEYVVVLDFIGNYTNNFMIPVALSGDRTYNADTIRRYVISGNTTIPGASTIHFDEVAREKIFKSIDKIRGIKTIIKDSYVSLKNRIGRKPFLLDFYEHGEIDPLVIIKEYKTYYAFLEAMERGAYVCSFTEQEKLILEYLSKTVLSGVCPYELEILKSMLTQDNVAVDSLQKRFADKYGDKLHMEYVEKAVDVLQGHFVSKEEEYQKYSKIDVLHYDGKGRLCRMASFARQLAHIKFYEQINDIVSVGLRRYWDKYREGKGDKVPFVLYEKYSRRDVSFLMNCKKDLSSTMYGMKRIGDDVFIFVTYHKEQAGVDKNYVDGKPDYADAFEDNMIFRWDSQIGKGKESSYMLDVTTAKRKHLFVKKSDAEIGFYYMGQFDIIEINESQKENNRGKKEVISKVRAKMHHPVRDDLLRYLQSGIIIEENVG